MGVRIEEEIMRHPGPRDVPRPPVADGFLGAAWLLVVLGLAVVPALGSESASLSFRLKQSTVNASGSRLGSGSYRIDSSAGQELAIGASSSSHFVLQSGFWSFAGSGVVPVVLTLDKSGNGEDVDLLWSGNNSPYKVYQSPDCRDVFSAPPEMVPGSPLENVMCPKNTLICFNVLPTAPGPK